MPSDLPDIVDIISLVYHEARNVRHPIRKGTVADAPRFARLVELPTGRNPAWLHLEGLRSEALNSGSIDGARVAFEKRFGLAAADLAELYARPIWKGSATGGNKWAEIASKLCALLASAQDDPSRAGERVREILGMSHNTGRVSDKLAALRALQS